MIEFKGKVTSKNAIKIQARMLKTLYLISILLAILIMFLLLCSNRFFRMMFLIATPMVIVAILICPNKFVVILPERLWIDTDEWTISMQEKDRIGLEYSKMLDTVTKVEDYGDCYIFYFGSRLSSAGFIAQKDLITQGTMEEFEEIFEEVLVRAK